jgi:hypothetical protein
MLREFAKLLLGVIQSIPIGIRKMPHAVSAVQVVMDAIDHGAYVARTVAVFPFELSWRTRRQRRQNSGR